LAEHFERVSSLSSLYQELADDLINGYLSISSHKLNQIMKVFTGFTVVFLPLSLMTGIYGMNFDYMPQLHWHYGYYAVLASTVVLIFGGLIVAKWRRWF
jgi:magnesium transporter